MTDDWTAKTSLRSTACPEPPYPPRQPDMPIGYEVPAWLVVGCMLSVAFDILVAVALALHL